MKQHILSQCAGYSARTAEVGEHFKNGATPKSLTSKRTFKVKWLFFTLFTVMVSSFASCEDDKQDDKQDVVSSLSAPTGVTATVNSQCVVLSWNRVSGATYYEVYRSSTTSGSYSKIGDEDETYSEDWNPFNGNNYYKIVAVKENGPSEIRSAFSIPAHVNYSSNGNNNSGEDDDDKDDDDDDDDKDGGGKDGTTVPSAPTGVRVANEGNATIPLIAIRWSSVSNATGYRVYRSSSTSGTYSYIGNTTYTVLSDDNPREGTTYYKVTAYNSAGESNFSDYASFTFKANDVSPCPVTYGNCTVSGTTITMRWTVPTTSGCGTPTKAYLRVANPDGGYIEETLSGTATSASFTYPPWVNSDGYVYIVIITENDKGATSGAVKVYDARNKKWIN
jgi:fibronectin type 3 domain-containing protein